MYWVKQGIRNELRDASELTRLILFFLAPCHLAAIKLLASLPRERYSAQKKESEWAKLSVRVGGLMKGTGLGLLAMTIRANSYLCFKFDLVLKPFMVLPCHMSTDVPNPYCVSMFLFLLKAKWLLLSLYSSTLGLVFFL